VGSVLSRSASERAGSRTALLLGAMAAAFPDIDLFFTSSRLQYLREHRSWSHSFVYLPLFALGFALVTKMIFRRSRLPVLWLFAAIGLASHVLFDWITSFGTMFLVPFTRTRFSLDWVFIIDPIFTGICFSTLLAALIWRQRGRRVAAIGGAVLGCYILFCAALHARALETWRRLGRPPDGSVVAVLPQFLSPFRWLGLSERPGEVHAAFFDIGPFARPGRPDPQPPEKFWQLFSSLADYYPPPEKSRIRVFHQPPPTKLLPACPRQPDVEVYLAFARFPLATLHPEPGGGAVITWEDLRFLPWFAGPWGRDRRGGIRREPFVYRIRVDSSGQAIERSFVTGSGVHSWVEATNLSGIARVQGANNEAGLLAKNLESPGGALRARSAFARAARENAASLYSRPCHWPGMALFLTKVTQHPPSQPPQFSDASEPTLPK